MWQYRNTIVRGKGKSSLAYRPTFKCCLHKTACYFVVGRQSNYWAPEAPYDDSSGQRPRSHWPLLLIDFSCWRGVVYVCARVVRLMTALLTGSSRKDSSRQWVHKEEQNWSAWASTVEEERGITDTVELDLIGGRHWHWRRSGMVSREISNIDENTRDIEAKRLRAAQLLNTTEVTE